MNIFVKSFLYNIEKEAGKSKRIKGKTGVIPYLPYLGLGSAGALISKPIGKSVFSIKTPVGMDINKLKSFSKVPINESLIKNFAGYIPKSRVSRMYGGEQILVPKNVSPAILAHEIEHSLAGRIGKFSMKTRGLGLTAAMAGVIMSGSKSKKARKYGPGLAVIGTAPILLEEGRASIQALKKLKKLYGSPGLKHGLKTMSPAFATYLLTVGTPLIGGAFLAKKLREGHTNKK